MLLLVLSSFEIPALVQTTPFLAVFLTWYPFLLGFSCCAAVDFLGLEQFLTYLKLLSELWRLVIWKYIWTS